MLRADAVSGRLPEGLSVAVLVPRFAAGQTSSCRCELRVTSPRCERVSCNGDLTAGQSCNIETTDRLFELIQDLRAWNATPRRPCSMSIGSQSAVFNTHTRRVATASSTTNQNRELVILAAIPLMFLESYSINRSIGYRRAIVGSSECALCCSFRCLAASCTGKHAEHIRCRATMQGAVPACRD
jgi:hypothetical protein